MYFSSKNVVIGYTSTMDHNLTLVLILTVGFALASVLAYITQWLKLPSILGYLLAGFIIGPYSPGYVADASLAEQMAEIGVILMLFGVGLHFKLQDLINVKNIAIPGATGQTLVAMLLATGVVYLWGWNIEAGLIIGLAIGVASTVVLVRVLNDNRLLNTKEGHIAIGWLVVEDIFTVVILILIPTLANFSQGGNLSIMDVLLQVLIVLGKFCLLALLMFTVGHKMVDTILTKVARLRSQELFTLSVLALIFVIATGSTVVFGTSIALGAFIAGMVIGKTSLRHQAAANALPLKDIFAIIFFLSVGMLFNPLAIVNHFPLFIGIISIILIAKPLTAYLITTSLGYSFKVALTVAISLAQIGEFSFILAEEAMKFSLIPEDGFDLLVACALVSISINPLLFQFIKPLENFLNKFSKDKKHIESTQKKEEKLKIKPVVIIIGFGPIGKGISEIASVSGYTPVIIEQNIDTVSSLENHHEILFGDAADMGILKEAHIEEASFLIITIPDTEKMTHIVQSAKTANPKIEILARVQYISEKPAMDDLNIHYICTESEALKSFHALISHHLKTNNDRSLKNV